MSEKIFLKELTLPITDEQTSEVEEVTYQFVQTDDELETAGDAADAKATGDALNNLKGAIEKLDGTLITDTESGAIVTIPDGSDNFPVRDLTVQIEPIQEGSGDPSPTNIRPIRGWTGVNVKVSGINMFDVQNASYGPTYDSKFYVNGFRDISVTVNASDDVTLNRANDVDNYGFWANLGKLKKGDYSVYVSGRTTGLSIRTAETLPTGSTGVPRGNIVSPYTNGALFTVTDENLYTILTWYDADGVASVNIGKIQLIPLEAQTASTPYYTYTGHTYPVTFPAEAGTVYGGTLDVTRGVLTVTMAEVDLGTYNDWGKLANGVFTKSVTGIKGSGHNSVASNIICPKYKNIPWNGNTTDTIALAGDGDMLKVRDTTYSDATTFMSSLSGVQLVYELSTPVTYQLTPTEVKTLLGLNNIWADTGNTDVEYVADTKLYIQKLTQPTEDDMVANANIASGTYFMIGNNLYLSTTTIPAGDTINPGTNCTQTNLAAALNAINA